MNTPGSSSSLLRWRWNWVHSPQTTPAHIWDIHTFSRKVLSGQWGQPDAHAIVTIRRYKEHTIVRHQFVTVEVTSSTEHYWLRIERRVQSKAKFLTLRGLRCDIDSYDTVSHLVDHPVLRLLISLRSCARIQNLILSVRLPAAG